MGTTFRLYCVDLKIVVYMDKLHVAEWDEAGGDRLGPDWSPWQGPIAREHLRVGADVTKDWRLVAMARWVAATCPDAVFELAGDWSEDSDEVPYYGEYRRDPVTMELTRLVEGWRRYSVCDIELEQRRGGAR